MIAGSNRCDAVCCVVDDNERAYTEPIRFRFEIRRRSGGSDCSGRRDDQVAVDYTIRDRDYDRSDDHKPPNQAASVVSHVWPMGERELDWLARGTTTMTMWQYDDDIFKKRALRDSVVDCNIPFYHFGDSEVITGDHIHSMVHQLTSTVNLQSVWTDAQDTERSKISSRYKYEHDTIHDRLTICQHYQPCQ